MNQSPPNSSPEGSGHKTAEMGEEGGVSQQPGCLLRLPGCHQELERAGLTSLTTPEALRNLADANLM